MINSRSFNRLSFFAFAATLCVAVAGLASCGPDDDENIKPGKGFYNVNPQEPQIGLGGGTVSVSFVTIAEWSATSTDTDWCQITSSASGPAGANTIQFSCSPTESNRKVEISITVAGYSKEVLCTILQQPAQTQGGTTVNHWISNIMSQKYLWNTAYSNIKNTLNFSNDYSTFLSQALTAVRVNEEDGYYDVDGNRYFYSNIVRYENSANVSPRQAVTRAESMLNNFGINFMRVSTLSPSVYELLICSVYPGSPADKAGLTRGTYISRFNGAQITDSNLLEVFYTMLGYQPYYTGTSVSVKAIRLVQNSETKEWSYVPDEKDTVLVPGSYDADPIIYSSVYSPKEGSDRIAYLSLATFDYLHDEELIEKFKEFKEKGTTDLILDLRYNPGGYVYSSAVLATAIVGEAQKDKVYSHMQYNADRTATGEVGYFYIGKDPSMQQYPLIAKALEGALDLERVYILTTDNTASASELVINGLRGLDFEVFTVGTTTQGKNTGMEVQLSNNPDFSNYDFENYVYAFEPITFYNLNAKGFGDYHSGFEPTFEVDEAEYALFDWKDFANNDVMMMSAVYHITTGAWPEFSSESPKVRRIDGVDSPKSFVPDGFRLEGKAKVFAGDSAE